MLCVNILNELIEIIKTNPKTSVTIGLTIIGLIFGFWRILLTRKKLKMDINEFENKKSKFSIYLEDSFRIKTSSPNSERYLLFHVRITNLASSKNSFIGNLEILYETNSGETKNLKLKHNSDLFKKIDHKNLTELKTDIRTDEREIKSGWLIFQSPSQLNNVRIKKFTIRIKDSSNNDTQISSTLMKDLIYENKDGI